MRIRYCTGNNGKLIKKALIYTSGEHGISPSMVDADARRILRRLKEHGHQAYIVGGAVRDLVLGKEPNDFDIVSDALPNRIKRIFGNSRIIGKRFRLVHVYYGPKIYEVSTFRSLEEGSIGNSFGNIDEDVLRRDFSCNALYYDSEENILIDYVDGLGAIKKGRLKPIIARKKIFTEDPVRMIRAIKYSCNTGLNLPISLRCQIQKQATLLKNVSASRLTEELIKIINSGKCENLVKSLRSAKLFCHLQPHADALLESSPPFASVYFKSLAELDVRRLAKAKDDENISDLLEYLLQDYVDTLVDWPNESGQSYKEIAALARKFIMPMNPPRIAFERAMCAIFQAHGIQIRRQRRPGDSEQRGEAPVRKKRRHRRRPTASTEATD